MNGFSAEPGERSACGHVDLAGAALVEIVGGRDAREHLAGRVVDHDDRDRDVGAERARALARQLLEALLQRRVDGEAMQLLRRARRRPPASAACGASAGIGRRAGRHRLAPWPSAISSAGMRPAAATRSSTRSRAWRAAVGRAVGPARLGRLRQRDQQRRLGERQPARLLAEIGERGGAHAFEIAAIGREREIEREDLVLAQSCARAAIARTIWRSLAPSVRSAPRLEQARDLHGQRRAAGDDAAVARELPGRARHRQRIDAAMRSGSAGPRRRAACREARIDIGRRSTGSRQRPSRRGIGPQQPAVAVEHLRRELDASPSGAGPSESIHQRASACNKTAADAAPSQRRRNSAVPSPLAGEG